MFNGFIIPVKTSCHFKWFCIHNIGVRKFALHEVLKTFRSDLPSILMFTVEVSSSFHSLLNMALNTGDTVANTHRCALTEPPQALSVTSAWRPCSSILRNERETTFGVSTAFCTSCVRNFQMSTFTMVSPHSQRELQKQTDGELASFLKILLHAHQLNFISFKSWWRMAHSNIRLKLCFVYLTPFPLQFYKELYLGPNLIFCCHATELIADKYNNHPPKIMAQAGSELRYENFIEIVRIHSKDSIGCDVVTSCQP